MKRFLYQPLKSLFLLLIISMASCAQLNSSKTLEDNINNASANKDTHATPSLQEVEAELNEELDQDTQPFEIQSFYALLIAEMAYNRQKYDTALYNYVKQAEITRDPGVVRRAAQISQALNQKAQLVEMAELWADVEPNNSDAQTAYNLSLISSNRLEDAFNLSVAALKNKAPTTFKEIAYGIIDNKRAENKKITSEQPSQQSANNKQNGYDDLQLRFGKQLHANKQNTDLLLANSILAESNKDLELALKYASNAHKIDTTDLSIGYQEMRMLSALQRNNEAIKKLSQLVDTHPDNNQIRTTYARALAEKKDPEAIKQFKILLLTEPENSTTRFRLGLAHKYNQETKEASYHFQELIRREQLIDQSLYQMAAIRESEEKWQPALDYLAKINTGDMYFSALSRRVKILLKIDKKNQAFDLINTEKTLAKRQQNNDSLEQVYLLEAESYSNQKDLNKAVNALNEGIHHLPDSSNLLYARAIYGSQTNDSENIIRDLRSALKIKPNDPDIMNALGYTLADKTSLLVEARQLIVAALKQSPNSAAFLDSMGWVEYKDGNLKASVKFLSQAFKEHSDPEIAAHYGEVLWQLNKKKTAKKVWQKGLSTQQDNPVLLETLKRFGIK